MEEDFSGGPAVRAPRSQCRGRGFDPRVGKFRVPHGEAKKMEDMVEHGCEN